MDEVAPTIKDASLYHAKVGEPASVVTVRVLLPQAIGFPVTPEVGIALIVTTEATEIAEQLVIPSVTFTA